MVDGFDFSILVPAGLFVLGLLGLFLNSSARFMTLREHEEFGNALRRELDQLHRRIDFIEHRVTPFDIKEP